MKISVFGKNSVNLVYGGSGSGGGNAANNMSLYTALRNAGFDVNPTLESFYNSSESGEGRDSNPAIGASTTGLAIDETPQAKYAAAVKKATMRTMAWHCLSSPASAAKALTCPVRW